MLISRIRRCCVSLQDADGYPMNLIGTTPSGTEANLRLSPVGSKSGALDENRTRDLFFTKEKIASTTARIRVYRTLLTSLILSLN